MRLIIMQGTGGLASRASMGGCEYHERRGNSERSNPVERADGPWQGHIRHTDEDGTIRRTPRTATLPKRPKTMPQRSGLGSGPICLRRIARSHSASSQPNGSTRG